MTSIQCPFIQPSLMPQPTLHFGVSKTQQRKRVLRLQKAQEFKQFRLQRGKGYCGKEVLGVVFTKNAVGDGYLGYPRMILEGEELVVTLPDPKAPHLPGKQIVISADKVATTQGVAVTSRDLKQLERLFEEAQRHVSDGTGWYFISSRAAEQNRETYLARPPKTWSQCLSAKEKESIRQVMRGVVKTALGIR